MSTVPDQLQALADLLDKGLITRDEFEREKNRLMTAPQPSPSAAPIGGGILTPGSAPESLGSYAILSQIGQGGMGVVYRGRHRSETFAAKQGGDVAIKVLHAQYAARPEIVERFEREAEMGIKLEHPGIVRAIELIMDGGQVALVMELVEGQPLDQLIGTVTGPIPWSRAHPIFQQMLDAVGFAHSQGVIHRDLKPENVIVGTGGQIKILDFGIAKELNSDKTKTGTGMGTVDYMAPEQYLDAKAVDQRADIYALGMTLYQVVAGRLPWEPSTTQFGILEQKKNGDLPPPTHFYPDIPPQIVAAITRATQSAIGDRFASTQDFAAALTEASPATPAPQARAAAAGTMIEPPSQSPPSAPPSNSSPTPAPSPRPPPPKSSPPHGPQKRGGGMGLGLILLGLLFLIVLGSVAIFVLVEPAKDFLIDQMDSSSSRSSKKKKDRDDDDAPPKPREVALGSHSLRHGCLPRDDSYGSYVYITGVDVEQYRTVVHMSATNRRSRAIQFYVDDSNRQGFHLVGSDGHPELYQSGVIGIENRRYAKRVQPGETVYFSVYFPELDRSVQSYHLFETEGFKSRSFDPQSTTSWTCLDVTLPME